MSNKKYELLKDDTITINNKTLYRIKALIDFDNVCAGDLGGYIEKEENLSHEGDCWVYDYAKVFDSAEVSGNAKIFDDAKVYGRTFIYDNAQISDYAEVYDYAEIYNNTIIYDYAKVFDNAIVRDHAKVYGNANVYSLAEIEGNAEIYDNAKIHSTVIIGGYTKICGDNEIVYCDDYLTISKIGSRDDTITFIKSVDNKIKVTTGCFYGNLKTFKRKVWMKHYFNKYAKEYKLAIKLAKIKFK